MSDNDRPTETTFDDALLDDDVINSVGLHPITNFVSDAIAYVDPTASVRDAAVQLRTADVSLAVVGNQQQVLGVVSERDIVRAVALDLNLDLTLVDAVETDELKWATVDSTVDDVVKEMLQNYLRHVLVRHDDGSLAGVASMRDLLAVYMV